MALWIQKTLALMMATVLAGQVYFPLWEVGDAQPEDPSTATVDEPDGDLPGDAPAEEDAPPTEEAPADDETDLTGEAEPAGDEGDGITLPAAEGTPDTNWFNAFTYAQTETFTLETADQLAGLATVVNGTAGLGQAYDFAGKTVLLAAGRHSLAAYAQWVPIGTAALPFRGVFDGKGATLLGLAIAREGEACQGLFGALAGSTTQPAGVRDLTLEAVTIEGGNHTGAVAGQISHANVEGVTVTGSVAGRDATGGLVGYASGTCRMAGNAFDGEVAGQSGAGGILGQFEGLADDTILIQDAEVTGTVTGQTNTGGVAGDISAGTLEGCTADVIVTGGMATGGIAGLLRGTASGCMAKGTVTATGSDAGGIAGSLGGYQPVGDIHQAAGTGTLLACAAHNTVQGTTHVGGVAGFVSGSEEYLSRVEQCYATGAVTGDSYVGGVAGHLYGLVANCYATGSITGGTRAGGIAGATMPYADPADALRATIQNCYATGDVSGGLYTGGICGSFRGGVISGSVSLSATITGTRQETTGRIAGGEAVYYSTLSGNHAFSGTRLALPTGAFTPPEATQRENGINGAAVSATAILESDRDAAPPWQAFGAQTAQSQPLWNKATPAPTLAGLPGLQNGNAPAHLEDEPTYTPPADGRFVSHPGWVEATGADVYQRYRDGEKLMAVYYRGNARASKNLRAVLYTWLRRHGVTIYGVAPAAGENLLWLFPGQFSASYALPLVVFANGAGGLEVLDGGTPLPDICNAFESWNGAGASGANFAPVNDATLASFATGDLSPWLRAEGAIQTGNAAVKSKSAQLTAGLATQREKYDAIHRWVSETLYYDHEMFLRDAGRPVDAAGILAQAGKGTKRVYSSAPGYANLTAALCRAAGIPCRVVSGYSPLYGNLQQTATLTAAMDRYLLNGDAAAFAETANPLRNHAWVAVFLEGAWHWADPTLDCGSEVFIDGVKGYPTRWAAGPATQSWLLPGAGALAATHCVWDADALTLAKGFSLETTHLKLPAGSEATLAPVPVPAGSAFRHGTAFTWKLDDIAIATVAGGRLEAHAPGTTILRVEGTIAGKLHKASCTVTVVAALEGLVAESDTITLYPGQKAPLVAGAQPAASLVPAAPVWALEGGNGVVALAGDTVTALAPGRVRATAALPGYAGLSAGVDIVVCLPPEKAELDQPELVLSPGDAAILTGRVAPAEALQSLSWHSDDERVVQVEPGGDTAAALTALRPGIAIITATTPDGERTATCRVTVTEPTPAKLELRETRLVLAGDEALLHLAGDDAATPPEYKLYCAGTRAPATLTDVLLPPAYNQDGPEGGTITLRAAAGAKPGSYVLRVQAAGQPRAAAECTLVVAAPRQSENKADYAALYLDTPSLTLHTRGGQAPVVSLRQSQDGRIPVSLAGATVRPKGGTASSLHGVFTFAAVDDERLEVFYSPPRKPKGVYRFDLEAVIPLGGGKSVTLPVAGRLAVTVKTGKPKLTAPTLTIDTFISTPSDLTDEALRTAAITVKEGAISQLRARKGKNLPGWVTLNTDEKTATVQRGTAQTGTLYLEAMLAGWGDGDAADDANWYPFTVKVKRSYAKPALKLNKTTAPFYLDTARSTGTPLALLPKRGGATLARLGVTDLKVAPVQQGTFTVDDFDAGTGAFRLAAAPNADAKKLRGTVWLEASVADTAEKVPLKLKLRTVSAGTVVKLKAPKTSYSLNPAMPNGDSLSIPLSANIAGFDLSQKELTAAVYDKTGKKPPPNGDYAPTASVTGSMLTLRAGPHAAPGKSYRVKITLPAVNPAKGGGMASHVLTLKLSTAKKSAKTKVTFTARGSVDLTTGAAATLTASFGGTHKGLAGEPYFKWYTAKNKPLEPKLADAFELRPTGAGTWRVGLKPGHTLKPGTYRLGIDRARSPLAGGGTPAASGTVAIRVKATQPKLLQSAKTVTLYYTDRHSEGVFTLRPADPACEIVSVLPADVGNASCAFTVRELGDGRYAVVFDTEKDQNAPAKATSRTLTLRVKLAGNQSAAASVKMRVVVRYRK